MVGFSVLKTANEPVIADFQKTDAGKDVKFTTSYGASGDQSRAVIGGLPTDEVHLSLEPDVSKIVDAGLIDSSWNQTPTKGILTDSEVVFLVRKGNPLGIKIVGRHRQAGRQGHHPQPRLVGLGEVEHPGRLGARCGSERRRRQGPGLRHQGPPQHRRPPGQR